MYLNASGNVGIGTTSPNGKMTVVGNTFDIRNGAGGYGTGYALEFSTNATIPRIDLIDNGVYTGNIKSSSGLVTLQNSSNNALAFGTNNAERMRITSGGVVAIGTTTNLGGGNLEVQTNGVSAFTARSSSTTGASGGTTVVSLRSVDSSASYWANAQYNAWQQIFCVSGSTEAMRITSGGNVGIGTTTPARGLSIFNNTIGLYSSTTGQGSTDGYTMELAGTTAYLWNYENDSLIFGTANSTRMTIKNNGIINLLVVPTSTAGLTTGDVYKDGSGFLKIV